jgi:starch-binding outer membrane protein, SusD/RagB family
VEDQFLEPLQSARASLINPFIQKNYKMKNIKKFLLVLMVISISSCGDGFLDEKPLDFFSTNNAFEDTDDFNASVNDLYALVRTEFYNVNDYNPMEYLYRTDVAFQITTATPNLDADFSPTSGIISNHWERLYKIVAESNTIISRIPTSKLNDGERVLFEAKARFFRAFAYRALAYLFGGVPLVTEEITVEKVDFTRATREEVYAQAIADLIFAAQNLPAINDVKDGEVSSLVAQHVLAEVYLAAGQYQNAVDAATVVIDDPNTDLMTVRFGSRSTVTPLGFVSTQKPEQKVCWQQGGPVGNANRTRCDWRRIRHYRFWSIVATRACTPTVGSGR